MSKEIEIVSFVMPWHFESGEYSSGKRGKPFYIRCFGYWNPEYTSETRFCLLYTSPSP